MALPLSISVRQQKNINNSLMFGVLLLKLVHYILWMRNYVILSLTHVQNWDDVQISSPTHPQTQQYRMQP